MDKVGDNKLHVFIKNSTDLLTANMFGCHFYFIKRHSAVLGAWHKVKV